MAGLIWKDTPDKFCCAVAKTPLTEICIYQAEGVYWAESGDEKSDYLVWQSDEDYESLESAKAIAQDWFDVEVLKCLELVENFKDEVAGMFEVISKKSNAVLLQGK